MRRNQIIVSSEPGGKFVRGFIGSGLTPKPGIAMQVDHSVALVGGRQTWKPYDADIDGGRPKSEIIILTEDFLQGRTYDSAYAAGEYAFGYVPVAKDELNLRLQDLDTGTSTNDILAGTVLIPDDGTGNFTPTTGSPEIECAVLNEDMLNLNDAAQTTGGNLGWCTWTGY